MSPLPNLGMNFTAFDTLPASELDDLVENIEALAAGTGLNVSAVTPEKILTGTGTTWPWTAYTPTWSKDAGTPPTTGNSTVNGKYKQIGKTVIVHISFIIGSTANANGAGSWLWALPVTAHAGMTAGSFVGSVYAEDVGTTAWGAHVSINSTTTIRVLIPANSTTTTLSSISATVPFTWNTGDYIRGIFTYEAA